MNLDVQRKAGDEVSREIARNCLLTRTRQISRVLTAIYDEELRPFGIDSSQFTLLVLIMELGPLSRSDLGRKNHHDRSTLTRNLQPLISQGWVSEGWLGAMVAAGRFRDGTRQNTAAQRCVRVVGCAKQSQSAPRRDRCQRAHRHSRRVAAPHELSFCIQCCICNTTGGLRARPYHSRSLQ